MNAFRSFLFLLLLPWSIASLYAQVGHQLWSTASQEAISHFQNRWITPQKERVYQLDELLMQQHLSSAPEEFSIPTKQSTSILPIPLPDGSIQHFAIVHSPVMERGLQNKYPNIRTYAGQGIDDPTATIRLDVTPAGFHAMILSSSETVFIDPYSRGTTSFYSSYYKRDFDGSHKEFICHFEGQTDPQLPDKERLQNRSFGDCQFRSFRLALAATGEYTLFHGGKTQAIAAQITTMNRVNGVLEREVAVRLVIIANNDTLIYTSPSGDPYTNNNGSTMLGQNQSNIDMIIGSANYDLGHVFSTGGGGIANRGSLCSPANKAGGVTGLPAPVGDPFDIDFVAHEIGHQLGANHTFNGTAGNCGGGNRNLPTAFEPGSGSTILAYAGICSPQNIQNNSDDYYHAISLEEMASVITSVSCGTILSASNNEPIIGHGQLSFWIPANTPFFLESAATDQDGDNLTYCWEQIDNENSPQPPVASSPGGPLFRSLDPSPNPRRTFPNLTSITLNSNPPWEVLPSVSRELNFRVTVRDNVIGGCTDSEDAIIQVDGNSGPFLVTHPNTAVSWFPNSLQMISWDVANTDQPPVSSPLVDILLSLDGGMTYPIVLATQVPNNGSALIQAPDTSSFTCRVRVQSSNSVFFDISDENFVIVQPASPGFTLYWPSTEAAICIAEQGSFLAISTNWQGFSDSIFFSFDPLPQGISVMASPISPGDSAQILISTDQTIAAGSYSVTVTANAGNASPVSQVLQVDIGEAFSTSSSLLNPLNGSSGIGTESSFSWNPIAEATSYVLEIATTPAFGASTIFLQSGISDPGFSLQTSLASETAYYWRVAGENACGLGPFSQIWGFQTGQCLDSASMDVPKTIPLVGSPLEVDSDLPIVTAGQISDVNVVNLGGTHQAISELTISLISPAGTEVILFSGICSASDQNFQLNFDDDASQDMISCPPTDNGFYQPQGNLSDFEGEGAFGIWKLKITDAATFNNGELISWGLEICVGADALPELITNQGLSTNQWSLDTITDSRLEAIDGLSGPANVIFTVVDLPQHGGLLLDGVNLTVGDQFSQEDISMNRFAYLNNGDTAAADSFRFDVQNAAGGWIGIFTFPIEVQGGINAIEALSSLLSVKISPNPVQDHLLVELRGEWRGKGRLRFSSIQGQLIYHQNLQKNGELFSDRISVSRWARGVYLLEIQTEQGSLWEKVLLR